MSTIVKRGLFGDRYVGIDTSVADRMADERWERQQTEALIVTHMEAATSKKYVVVNGKGHYIPKKDAVRLGLIDDGESTKVTPQ